MYLEMGLYRGEVLSYWQTGIANMFLIANVGNKRTISSHFLCA